MNKIHRVMGTLPSYFIQGRREGQEDAEIAFYNFAHFCK